ncbi:MAG: DUF4097 family beta strand repeat protein [Clostridia bacterium]|nr:DUF4097 family beta strand repeat protein [Clostridia bacterium]
MKLKTKISLIVAGGLIVLASIIFVAGMSILKWDFTKLSSTEYETNEYEITDDFNNILIKTDTSDIVFLPGDNEKVKVVLFEQKNLNHNVSADGGALKIELNDTRKWYEHITLFSFGSPKITVYLPKKSYDALNITSNTGDINIPKDFSFSSIDISISTGDVTACASSLGATKIKTSTGGVNIDGISTSSLDITVTTGKIKASNVKCEGDVSIKVSTGKSNLENVQCKNLFSKGSTGDITLKNVIAQGSFSIERSTGDVTLDLSDASEITIKTDTGDVTGTLLTEKIFIPSSDTGNIKLPGTTSGGKCKVTTDTGDIKISIAE